MATARCRKPKVVFVLGAKATVNSKLVIALAKHFNGEVIDFEKMQVHDGFPVITTNVVDDEHALGGVHAGEDSTVDVLRREASRAIGSVLSRARLPIVAGASNSYIEALVEGDDSAFRIAHDCLFIWVDVNAELLCWYTSMRVEHMVRHGFMDDAISEPDLGGNDSTLLGLLNSALDEISLNTFDLASKQVKKIKTFCSFDGWDIRRIGSKEFFARKAEGTENEETWEKMVWGPSVEVMRGFLGA